MRFKGIIQKVVALCCAVTVCAAIMSMPTPEVRAASTSELKNKISDYDDKIDAINDKIDSLEDDKKEASALAEALQEKIDNLENQISLVNRTIDELNARIDEAQDKIEAKEKEIDDAKDLLKQRLRAIYIAGSNSSLQVLLSAESFADYLAKSELMRGVTKHDTQLMDKLNNDIKEINKLKKEIEADKADAKEMKAELVDKQNELDKEYQRAQAAYDKADSKQSDLSDQADELEAAKAQVQAEWEAAIKAESDRNREFNSGGSSSGSSSDGDHSSSGHDSTVSSFGFVWPFQSSYYISVGYMGYAGHTGVDITCSGALGKPIYAAASGRVIRATWSNVSYGNHLLIDHGVKDGSSVTTLYAHCQTLLVGEGEEVSQGQLIAYCGSTGNSTGPHLHFEVRLDGSPINPLSCF
ncbi:MAG: murein hydrolase activator EnvC family protein [Acutalibacteraceae bacterium]